MNMKKSVSVSTLAIILCLIVSCNKYEDPQHGSKINFSSYEKTMVDFLDTIPVTVPENFVKSDFAAFSATVESDLGSNTSLTTKSSNDSKLWEVESLPPVFDEGGKLIKDPSIVIKCIPMDGSDAVLTASLVNSDGDKYSTSVVISSANYDGLYETWEAICSNEIAKWEDSTFWEFVCWYMYFLNDAELDEEVSDEVLEFADSHMKLLLASKHYDLQDKAIAEQVASWKNQPEVTEYEERQEQSLNGLPSQYTFIPKRQICHHSLAGAANALAYKFDESQFSDQRGIVRNVIRRLCKCQEVDIREMYEKGVRVFEFPLILGDDGLLYGNSLVCRDCKPFRDRIDELYSEVRSTDQFAIIIVSASIQQTLKDLLSGEKGEVNDYSEFLDEMHEFMRDWNNYRAGLDHISPLVPFRADMTAEEAKGGIILFWGDEWLDNTTIEPFGAVLDWPLFGDMGAIQTWNRETQEWEDAADLMSSDANRFLGYCENTDYMKNKAMDFRYEVGQTWKKYQEKLYQPALPEPVEANPIWMMNRMDCVMNIPTPKIPRWIIRKKTEIDIPEYPNISWTACFINEELRSPGNPYGIPLGITFVNNACTQECYPPLFGKKTICYGDGVFDFCQSNLFFKMPYELTSDIVVK